MLVMNYVIEETLFTLQPERNARTKLTNSTNCKFSCIQFTCKFGQILAKFLFSPGVSFWLYGTCIYNLYLNAWIKLLFILFLMLLDV